MARDVEQLARQLRSYLPDGDRLRAVVPVSSAGYSNETYVLEGLDAVLRTPPSDEGLLPPYDMARQYSVMAALSEIDGAPPVPTVRDLCRDRTVIGDEFFLMGYVDGEAMDSGVSEWVTRADPDVRTAFCQSWIDAVADTNRIPPLPVLGAARAPIDELRRWRAIAESCSDEGAVQLFRDLEASPPAVTGPPMLVHGDPKLGNCLWQGPRLLALVDWELSYNGEPLADLAYMLTLWFPHQRSGITALAGLDLPGMPERERVIEWWEARTGRSSVDVLRYEAGEYAKLATILLRGAHLYETGASADPRLEYWSAGAQVYLTAARGVLP